MQLLAPGFLWLALLAVVPLVLHLFRRQSKRVRVSTMLFFKTLAREHQEAAWLRRLKRLLALLLALVALGGAVFALARPVVAPAAGSVNGVVLLVDRSASMMAADAAGTTRLGAARSRLLARLAGLPNGVPVALVAYDARPEVIQPMSTDRRSLVRALEAIEVRPIEGRRGPALAAAHQLARLATPAQVWHASDFGGVPDAVAGPPAEEGGDAGSAVQGDPTAAGETPAAVPPSDPEPEPEPELEGVEVVSVGVGLPGAVNAGITAFQVRPVPLEHARYEVYVQVALSSGAPESLEAEIEFRVGAGAPVPRRFELEPGQAVGLVVPVEGAEAQDLVLSVSVPGDCLALDDVVVSRLPERRPLVVHWVMEDKDKADPFTGLALRAMAEEGVLDVWKLGAADWPASPPPDVYVFDGWLPADGSWDDSVPAVVIDPPGAGGPVRAARVRSGGIPHRSVRASGSEHPVLFRVPSGRVAVTQTAVIDTTGSLEPLWFAGREPLLAAGESSGQRLVVMAFSPQRSEQLPLMAAYPVMLANAVYWCAEGGADPSRPQDLRTGDVIVAEGATLRWREPDRDGGSMREVSEPVAGSFVELDRVGLWETGDGRQGSALLLSRHESDLGGGAGAAGETPGGGGPGLAAGGEGGVAGGPFRGELAPWLIGLVVVALLVESWLFHRYGVY